MQQLKSSNVIELCAHHRASLFTIHQTATAQYFRMQLLTLYVYKICITAVIITIDHQKTSLCTWSNIIILFITVHTASYSRLHTATGSFLCCHTIDAGNSTSKSECYVFLYCIYFSILA